MALGEHSEDSSQSLIGSTPLFSESHVKDGLNVASRVDSSAHALPKGFFSESVFDDGLLQRRKSIARPRLPSFRGLGISSFERQPTRDSHALGTSYSVLEREVVEHSCPVPVASSAPRTGSTPLLTPPADLHSLKWTLSATISSSAASTFKTSVMRPIDPLASRIEATSLSDHGAQTENVSLETSGTGASESHQEPIHNNTTQSSFESSGASSWLDRAVDATGEHIEHHMTWSYKC